MDQIKGAQSIMFREAPYLISAASVAGSKEADGPIGKLFDVTDKDDLFGAQTWEEAESNMQKEACVLAAGKAHVDLKKIRYLFGGDLLRQGIATSMGVEALQIPMFGLYGACSTSGEALALASMSAAAGYGGTMIAVTSSHFGSAEKEFRFPLGYANQRPLSSHWTVTGSGAFLVQSAEEYRKQNKKPAYSAGFFLSLLPLPSRLNQIHCIIVISAIPKARKTTGQIPRRAAHRPGPAGKFRFDKLHPSILILLSIRIQWVAFSRCECYNRSHQGQMRGD